MTAYIFMIIGIMLFIGGIYYMIKDKNDSESKKIYLTVLVIGIVIAAFSAFNIFAA